LSPAMYATLPPAVCHRNASLFVVPATRSRHDPRETCLSPEVTSSESQSPAISLSHKSFEGLCVMANPQTACFGWRKSLAHQPDRDLSKYTSRLFTTYDSPPFPRFAKLQATLRAIALQATHRTGLLQVLQTSASLFTWPQIVRCLGHTSHHLLCLHMIQN
jgi:hypothetical protein